MAILNLNGNVNKRMTVAGKIELDNGLNTYFLKQDPKNKFLFYGAITENKSENPDKHTLTWNIKTHTKITMFVKGASKSDVPAIHVIEETLTKHIIEKETHRKTDFFKLFEKAKINESIIEGDEVEMKQDAKDEVVVTKTEKLNVNTQNKANVSEAVKSFMKEFGTTKAIETLELAVAKYNDALNDIALLEERLANNAKIESPEDPDDDPKGGQSIPAFDVAEFKTQLKAEILAELKEELKASSIPVTKTEIKLPTPKEEPIVSEKVIEQPKKKKVSELKFDDINNMSYEKLQKLGSQLKLGTDNVTSKEVLITRIANKLKITIPSAQEEIAIATEPLKLNKPVSTNIQREIIEYSEDIDGIDEDFNIQEEKSAVDQLEGMKFDDPAKQRLADLVLSKRK